VSHPPRRRWEPSDWLELVVLFGMFVMPWVVLIVLLLMEEVAE
jgi:hypothetical protein